MASPTDVANLFAWYEADSLGVSAGLTNGAAVATWADQSGNRYDVTQATGANQPIFNTNQINGLPALTFNGTTQFLGATIPNTNQPLTVFAFYKTATISGGGYYFGGGGGNIRLGRSSADSFLYAGFSLFGTDSLNTTNWFETTTVVNGASSSFRTNGAAAGSGNASTNNLGTTLDVGWDGGNQFWTGQIAELIVYNAALGITDIQTVEGYLNTKYTNTPSVPTFTLDGFTNPDSQLHAHITAMSEYTSYYFQYGLNAGVYPTKSPVRSLPAGSLPQAVSSGTLTVNPSTTYHYQLVATNTTGQAISQDATFNTSPPYSTPKPFRDFLLESTSPWNDTNGFWATYNASIATMFETVYDIVADIGDPDQNQVATLSAGITAAGGNVFSLSVTGVVSEVPVGTQITLTSGINQQTFVVSSDAMVGDSLIAVLPEVPEIDFPIGTPVQLAWAPGWSSLLDPNACPAEFLPFLAQFVGATVPVGLDSTTARAKILQESSQNRGTPSAIIAAVQRNLTGTQSVVLQERWGPLGANAYQFLVYVKPGEVLTDATSITNDVNAVKPGGVMWSLVITDGATIAQIEINYATISALEAAFHTVNGVEANAPGT